MVSSGSTAIATVLKSWRARRGLTLGKLSKLCGVSKATLSRWESGTHAPRAAELTAAMRTLEIPEKEQATALRGYALTQLSTIESSEKVTYLSLGECLYAQRLRAGLTQVEAARRAGITQSLLSRWERGMTMPSDEECHNFAFHMGASVDELAALVTRRYPDEKLPDDPDVLMRHILIVRGNAPYEDKELDYLALGAKLSSLVQNGKAEEKDCIALWGEQASIALNKYKDPLRARQILNRTMTVMEKIPGHLHATHVGILDFAFSPELWGEGGIERLRNIEHWDNRFVGAIARSYYLNVLANAARSVDEAYTRRLLDEMTDIIVGHRVEYPHRIQSKAKNLILMGDPAAALELLEKEQPLEEERDWYAGLWEMTRARAYAQMGSKSPEAHRALALARATLLPKGEDQYGPQLDKIARDLNVA